MNDRNTTKRLQRWAPLPARPRILAAVLLAAALGVGGPGLPLVHATLPAHNVAAARLNVVVTEPAVSITVTAEGAINDFRMRPTYNPGDYDIQIGDDATDDPANGVLMSCVAENQRDNYGTGYKSNFISAVAFNANGFWVPVFSPVGAPAGSNPEGDVNVAAAWFPFTNWLGGYALNGANNQPLTNFTGSPGLVLGTHFVDLLGGKSIVNLTSLGIDSRVDGVLLVSGAKNENSNFGLSQVNTADGTWNLFIKDAAASGINAFEQDPIAFVFIPRTNTTVISGRFLGDASIQMWSGESPQFTVTRLENGRYELKIAGHLPTTGVLMISPEGGGAVNMDNMVSYQVNAAGDGWEIESRDTPSGALESPGATEGVVSFVFLPGPTPGFTVEPASNLLTTENGEFVTFNVSLHTEPAADVTIAISSSNPAEGIVSPASLTFTPFDWNFPQTVTITGQDDTEVDGTVAYTVVLAAATSADPGYNGLKPSDVSAFNADNEPGITVSPTAGLTTTEAGGTATFVVHLNSLPSDDVTVALSSSDPTEGTVSPALLTFTLADWWKDHEVTVTGVDDAADDGDITYTIVTAPSSSTDPAYNAVNAPDVSVLNLDDDTAAIAVSASGPNGLSVVEGRTADFTVALTTQPAADVTVNIVSSDPTEGTVTPSLTFTPLNWNTPQTATVTGVDDLIVDGNINYFLTNTAASTDPVYAAAAPVEVLMTTLDNEPVLTLPSGGATWGTGMPGVGLDGRATIADPFASDYNGATLTVTLTANGTADDRLEIRHTGSGSGQIGVSGNSVTFEGATVATFAGGVGATPLTVTFNNAATPAAAEALVRNVTFRSVSTEPSTALRTASLTLAHADGGLSTADTTIRVGLLRVADFQEGADHGYGVYTGAADIELYESNPDTAYPAGHSAGGLWMDYRSADVANNSQVLLRFDNIVGNGPGQIPPNALIVSADLILYIPNPAEQADASGDGAPLYRMLIPWDATNATWNSMDGGVSNDDFEATSTFESQLGLQNGDASTGTGMIWLGVTPDVQAWVNGTSNFGWLMSVWELNLDATCISSSESTNINYRPRLQVKWVPADTRVASFRQNVNDYTSAFDTRIRANDPDTEFSTITGVFCDWAVSLTSDNEQVLLRFDDIFGDNPGQIPPGAQIHAAVLDLASVIGNAMGDGGNFHAMLQPWQDTSTWNSLVDGVTADGIEAAVSPTLAVGYPSRDPNVQAAYFSFELTPEVQAWASGARPNYGWVVLPWPGGSDGWGFGTAEQVNENNRPRLRVYYSPGAVTETITLLGLSHSATAVQIQFSGLPNKAYSVLRAETLGGTWTTLGPATTGADGKASYTDNAPLAGSAFYRVSTP